MSAELEILKQQMMHMQSQLAFQEDAVQSLDEALVQQQQEILLLHRQLKLLRERQQEQVAQNEAGPESDLSNEKPPHY